MDFLIRITITACAIFAAFAGECAASGGGAASVPSLWAGLPFAGLLLSIAFIPLFAPRFWHHNFGKVAALWSSVFAVSFVISRGTGGMLEIFHVFAVEYAPFIILLFALYTVSGGILLKGRFSGTPLANTALLAFGTLLASVVGTTGAAMVLIRPLLRANEWRKARAHQVVFFIFLVCNVGGSLTPLGDPPLFLGFIHGVPFFWTLGLAPPMALVSAILLALFFVVDSRYYRGEEPAPLRDVEPVRISGALNLAFMALVLAMVLFSGVMRLGSVEFLGIERSVADLLRDGALVAIAVLSLRTTPRVIREANGFSWFPMKEVAILFAGIFTTMIPVLAILKAGADGPLAAVVGSVREPAHYFWATGLLSSFLDNAPTYLVFLNAALGSLYPGAGEAAAIGALISHNGAYLLAISAGAVFMGAMTYIGNAPNFMARSVAEEAGVEMPSFFGYIFKYSLIFLVPTFAIVTWAFF